MHPDDHEPPVHRISRVEDRARVLAEALAHVEVQDAQYRLPMEPAERQPRWKPVAAVALFFLAGYLAFFPPVILTGARPGSVPAGERARGVRAALFLQAQQIEAYRLEHGQLPQSLQEVRVRFPGMEFVRSNSRVFQLVARRPDGEPIVYDSARPAPGVAALAIPWGVGDGKP